MLGLFDMGNFFFFTMLLGVGLPLVITVIVILSVVWSLRRVFPSGKSAADAELRDRLASGDISPAEFEAREDALKNHQ